MLKNYAKVRILLLICYSYLIFNSDLTDFNYTWILQSKKRHCHISFLISSILINVSSSFPKLCLWEILFAWFWITFSNTFLT